MKPTGHKIVHINGVPFICLDADPDTDGVVFTLEDAEKVMRWIAEAKEVNDALERERQDEEDKDWYLRNDTWIKDIENSETSVIAELHGRTNRNGVKEYAIVRWWCGRATVKLRFKGEIVEENL